MADMKDTNSKTENIHLVGFKLGAIEMASVEKIVKHHFQKLSQKAECKELKLHLRQHQHAKAFLHEISAEAEVQPPTTAGDQAHEGEEKGEAQRHRSPDLDGRQPRRAHPA